MANDVFSKEKRSMVMASVKCKNTKPERILRSALHKKGIRFRINYSALPGKPDIVLPKYRTVIFVNGCFWHQHPGCKKATIPVQNRRFWEKKLKRNIIRDYEVKRELEDLGWKVLTVWECELKQDIKVIVEHILDELKVAERDNEQRKNNY